MQGQGRGRAARPLEERFWELVKKDGPLPRLRPELGPCAIWLGALRNGYARFKIRDKYVPAYRFALELAGRPVPEGMEPDHLCYVRWCVREDHIEAVTHQVNTARRLTNGGAEFQKAKTHCGAGHPYDATNTRLVAAGRRCRTCDRLAEVRRQEKRRALRS